MTDAYEKELAKKLNLHLSNKKTSECKFLTSIINEAYDNRK